MLLFRKRYLRAQLILSAWAGLFCVGCPVFLEDDFTTFEGQSSGNDFNGSRTGPGGFDQGGSSFGPDPGTTIQQPSLSDCPGRCTCYEFEASAYRLCTDALPAADAAEDCAVGGGELVSVESASLNDWLSSMFDSMDVVGVWTSGSDAAEEGRWVWGNGQVYYPPPVSGYQAWARGEPDDMNGEDCMAINATSNDWHDLDCSESRAYACVLR